MSAYNFIRLGNADEPEILQLLNSNFKTTFDSNRWRWYSHEMPWGENRVYGVRLDNKLIGIYCVAPYKVFHLGNLLNIGYANHLAIDANSRSVSLFVDFSNYVFSEEKSINTPFLMGPPNKNAIKPHRMLCGWKQNFVADFLSYKPKSLIGHVLEPVADFKKIQLNDSFNGSEHYDFSVAVDVDYLNWRYLTPRHVKYYVYTSQNNACYDNFIVLKHWHSDNENKLHIIDLRYSNYENLKSLIDFASDCAYKIDATVDLWMCNADAAYKKIIDYGFCRDESKCQPVIFKDICASSTTININTFRFMYGDTDTY